MPHPAPSYDIFMRHLTTSSDRKLCMSYTVYFLQGDEDYLDFLKTCVFLLILPRHAQCLNFLRPTAGIHIPIVNMIYNHNRLYVWWRFYVTQVYEVHSYRLH